MSVDADRLVNLCLSFHELWSLPAQIGVALWLLYTQASRGGQPPRLAHPGSLLSGSRLSILTLLRCSRRSWPVLSAVQVQYAFLAGLALVVLLIPVNRALATRIQAASLKMMAAKDRWER